MASFLGDRVFEPGFGSDSGVTIEQDRRHSPALKSLSATSTFLRRFRLHPICASGPTRASSMCNKHTCGGLAEPSLQPRRFRNLVTKPSSASLRCAQSLPRRKPRTQDERNALRWPSCEPPIRRFES